MSATSGDDQLDVTVSVDNTAPEVSLDVSSENDTELGMHGDITLTASIDDGSGSGVPDSGVVAELDGVSIDVPYVTSTVDLAAGQHTFSVTATDAAGNIQTVTQTFTTVDEEPDSIDVSVASTGEIGDDGTGSVTVSATATDPTGDDLTVQFNEGTSLELGTDVSVSSGEVNDALSTDRSEGVSLTTEELADLGSTDGIGYTTTGSDALPYQLFTVTVPEGTSDEDQVRVTWEGTSNANAQVTLYAQLADGSGWTQVDRQYNEDGTSFTLTGYVPVADYAVDGVVTLVVQHSDGWSGEDTTTRDSEVEAYSDEATDRSDYDFTIAWESDTQYYNEDLSSNYYYLEDMNNFLMEERENLNLKYMLHTGDIVDDYDQTYEWENADQAYNILEEDADGNALSVDEKLPYGVLAGNHDVGHLEDDFATFGTYFGEDRYDDNPWYGGSYENNRGHYDLFSAGGIDFMVVSMGWDPGEEEIAWMNEVISAHPERVVILTFHEYMLTTGGLGPIPQTVYDEVVATNSNVKMVLSGHYHDAYTRYDSFDDDGDGVDDRTVTSMLFDYQALESGGLGYLRLMHFDNESETMTVRTYSPTLDDFNAEDSSLYGPNGEVETYQDFTISYETLGISPQTKILTTDAFSADVLTNAAGITDAEVETSAGIGEVSVASGEQAAVTWSGLEPGVYGVYATATDPYGAQIVSTVQTFTLRDDGSVVDGVASTSTGSDDGDDESSDNGGSSEGGDGGSSDNGGSSDEGDGGSSTGDDGDDAPTLTLLGGDTVRVGDTMTVTAEGLEPGADYTLTLHSTPVVVGQVTVGDAGTATFTFTIPSDTAVGDHTLQLTADAEPSVVLAELPIEVLAASDGSSLLNSSAGSVALWALAGLVLLAGGTGVVLLARRRAGL